MTDVVGHVKVRTALEAELPPVTMLRGQPSIGKLTLARHLADHHGIAPADRVEYVLRPLSVDHVRDILKFVSTAGFGPAGKLITIRLDAASYAARNALLKTLEEPPATARFILLLARETSATIVSRCRVFHLGLLSDDELRTILTGQGIAAPTADKLIANGDGTVAGTLNAPDDKHKDLALNVLRAVATHDYELFDRSMREFTEPARQWLAVWLSEAMTRRLKHFTLADMYGLHESTVFCTELCLALARYPDAGGRLAVRVALQPLLRQQ